MKTLLLFIALMAGTISATDLAFLGKVFINNKYCTYSPIMAVATPEAIWDPFVDFFSGIFMGANITFQSDLRMFQTCLKAPGELLEIWTEFYNFVKEINWENFEFSELMNAFMQSFGDSIGAAIPCIIIGMTIDKFVELILDPTLDNLKVALMKTLAQNIQTIFNDLLSTIMNIFDGDFYVAGEYIGRIIYIVVVH